MVPDIQKREWADILNGSVNPKLTNFSLQMKLNELKLLLYFQKISIDEAVSELHKYISSNEQMLRNDIYTIFNCSNQKK